MNRPVSVLVDFGYCGNCLPFSLPLCLGCLGSASLKGWGIPDSSLSPEWAICKYKLGTAVPLANVGNAAAGGSHFLIICSNSFALSVASCQVFFSYKACFHYGGHCIYKFVPLGLFCLT